MVPARISSLSPDVLAVLAIHLRPNSASTAALPVKTSPSRSVMNSTPPHFTWRPRLSNATCQSLALRGRSSAALRSATACFWCSPGMAPCELRQFEAFADREAPPLGQNSSSGRRSFGTGDASPGDDVERAFLTERQSPTTTIEINDLAPRGQPSSIVEAECDEPHSEQAFSPRRAILRAPLDRLGDLLTSASRAWCPEARGPTARNLLIPSTRLAYMPPSRGTAPRGSVAPVARDAP